MNVDTTKESPRSHLTDGKSDEGLLTTPTACENRKRLELQAQVIIGSLILAGVALGLLVHPYWFGLSAFFGAGLIIAGITDTCLMAKLLAKISGNQCCSAGRHKS